MSKHRMQRVNELLRREIGGQLYQLITEDEFDFAAVMITRVETSSNLRHAQVFVSIRDAEKRSNMMGLLLRHRKELQQHLNRTLKLKYTPRLSFHLDPSIERGDHILDVLADIEREQPGAPPAGGEGNPFAHEDDEEAT